MGKPTSDRLTLKRETLRELDRAQLIEVVGGLPVTGLCARTFQLPSCVASYHCTPEP
ncbi:MAG TPA: hypothetical protein VF137_10560 [Candidatus Dormibacteraeota bacterium]